MTVETVMKKPAAASAATTTTSKANFRLRHKLGYNANNKLKAKARLQRNVDAAAAAGSPSSIKRFRHLEAMLKQERSKIKELKDLKLKAAQAGQVYVESEPKLIFVVRLKGVCKIPHRAKKTMQILGLNRIFSGRFLESNKATVSMLRVAEPYLAWGYPTMKCVHDLIYKRGFASIHGQRIAISSNEMVAKHLINYRVSCVEDLIYEIFKVGENFKYLNKFLATFRLSSPRQGIVSKKRHFINGGDFGNRERYITSLINKML
ncbi:MAG: 60S ribosomal protein L7 [Marteilia pararefringens]